MKRTFDVKRLVVAGGMAGCLAWFGLSVGVSHATDGQDDQAAEQTLDAIIRGDFTTVTAHFDGLMTQKLSPQQLGSAWSTYQEALGAYQSHGDPQDVAVGGLTVVNIPLQMQNQPGQFRITFHGDGTIAGLFFLKADAPTP